MTNCPPEESLRRIGTDAVSEATFATMERHVEDCALCQERLEAIMSTVCEPVAPASREARPPLIPGLVLERELGRGGASVVYLAYEPALRRHVAVKLFPKNSLVDPHAREHWMSEARALSRVPHDHVVAIHRVDENDEWFWLVIEYVSGGTLKSRLAEPLNPRIAARLVETIARAVGNFHGRGVVHLDLKPSNILLGGEPDAQWDRVSPKISDFGIARLEGEPGATQTGANGPKGTPSYMAPEQVAAIPGTIGAAADVYALGALLYHLLTGRPPFQGSSTAETFDQVRHQEPVPPRRLNAKIPWDLETICLKCLEKSPKRRYASAEDLASDLRFWLEGRAIRARRISAVGHAWRWCRSHPAVAGLLVLFVTTLTTAIVGLFVMLERVDAKRTQLAHSNRSARAYAEFCASAATQLALLLKTSVHRHGEPSLEKKQATLLRLRDSIVELIKQGAVSSSTLTTLERDIGWALVASDKREEAYDLCRRASELMERRSAESPNDEQTRVYALDSVYSTGIFAFAASRVEDAFYCFERATAIALDSRRDDYIIRLLIDMHVQLYQLSRVHLHDRASYQERARRATEQIRIRLFGSDVKDPLQLPGTATTGHRLIQPDGLRAIFADRGFYDPRQSERFAAQWLTIALGRVSCSHWSSNDVAAPQDPEAWTGALISAIRERCAKFGIENSVEIELATVGTLFENAIIDAAALRKLGRHDDAKQTAARMVAIAQRLVREYPDKARPHHFASEAYDQVRKNAFPAKDDKLMIHALINAIEAGRRALAIDSSAYTTREHVDGLIERYMRIKADRLALGLPTPALPSAPNANGG